MTALRISAAALAAATAVTAFPGGGTSPAATARAAASPPALCHPYQLYRVVNYLDQYVTVRDDVFGHGRVCLAVRARDSSWFKITRTAAPRGQNIGAFPEIFYGCVYGKCTTGSVLPEQVTSAAGMVGTWRTFATRPHGLWNKAFDLWFSLHRRVGGQAAGAELMVWLDTTFHRPPPDRPVVRVAGRRYWFSWHRACNRGRHLCWNFLIFRRVHRVSGVVRLPLSRFIAIAERKHLIRPSWWLESVEAGFELWWGGVGLGTIKFGVIP